MMEKSKRTLLFSLVGLALILLGLSLGKWLSGPPYTVATFAHKYYYYGYPADSLLSLAKRSPSQQHSLLSAARAYQEQAYARQLVLFAQLPDTLTQQPTITFYTGLAQHYLKNKPQALGAFQSLSATPGPWQEPALWYQALTHVLHNEAAPAIPLLEQIDGPYREKAQTLLADIRE
jgi:hypothetical protein